MSLAREAKEFEEHDVNSLSSSGEEAGKKKRPGSDVKGRSAVFRRGSFGYTTIDFCLPDQENALIVPVFVCFLVSHCTVS